jgi:arginine exporter protein ArgO
MKNIFKLFGIIAIIAVIGFSFIACDDSFVIDEASFTMQGSSINTYHFYNQSSYEVKVTIGSSSKTISAKSSTFFTLGTSSASVRYSPASKVKPTSVSNGNATFMKKY